MRSPCTVIRIKIKREKNKNIYLSVAVASISSSNARVSNSQGSVDDDANINLCGHPRQCYAQLIYKENQSC